MSILKFLGLSQVSAETGTSGNTETVRKIVSSLESMDADKARYVASFTDAHICSYVAHPFLLNIGCHFHHALPQKAPFQNSFRCTKPNVTSQAANHKVIIIIANHNIT